MAAPLLWLYALGAFQVLNSRKMSFVCGDGVDATTEKDPEARRPKKVDSQEGLLLVFKREKKSATFPCDRSHLAASVRRPVPPLRQIAGRGFWIVGSPIVVNRRSCDVHSRLDRE